MLDPKIAAAVGSAAAASRHRGRSTFAMELEQAMVAAINKAVKDGVQDQEVVRGYIQAARVAVKEKYQKLAAARYITEEDLRTLALTDAE